MHADAGVGPKAIKLYVLYHVFTALFSGANMALRGQLHEYLKVISPLRTATMDLERINRKEIEV